MSKKILGLDLGTTSIGWAIVNEAETESEKSEIVKTGVRLVPLSSDESTDFSKGKTITINSDRTLKRGARRNLQRYKLRRDELLKVFKKSKIIDDKTILPEEGEGSTHTLWNLRAKSVTEKVSLSDFARILLSINKKRGYKSNRKAKDEGDGQAIDGMEVAKLLTNNRLTPGQYALELMNQEKKHLPDFYRSDLKAEFNKVWEFQQKFYPDILTDELMMALADKNKAASWAICKEPFKIVGEKRTTKGKELKKENYQWRVDALTSKLTLERLAIVLQEINGNVSNSSGYLGAISDRSKELFFQNLTIGEYLFAQLQNKKHARLKNQVFYRQDYIDEFEKIWNEQVKHHSVLTNELKKEIRDVIIFYQRRLKSQKGLISICELEKREIDLIGKDGEIVLDSYGKPKKRIVGPRVIPKSSPLFQEFKIWSILNNLEFKNSKTKQKYSIDDVDEELEIRNRLFLELNRKGKLSSTHILKIVFEKDSKNWELNYKDGLEGNNTNQVLFKAYQSIIDLSGHEGIDAFDIEAAAKIFEAIGIDKEILFFDSELKGKEYENQPSFQLWHLLYSYEGDDSISGDEKLLLHLKEKFGFTREYGNVLVNIVFKDDYGSLSTRAIRKILTFLKEGNDYSESCGLVGYNHSHSITKEENEKRELKEVLDLLPKNSLRNPVVEKILNQLVNVVNALIKEYGRPDEIRIELARDLKKSSKERADATKGINAANKLHDEIRVELKNIYPFNSGVRITRNDIIKYKLYKELESNGFKTVYTNTYVELGKLFSKDFDIEHIIPKSLLFDDSFSNKTLSVREFNRWKSNKTGIDAIEEKYGKDTDDFNRYINVIEKLFKDKKISKTKYRKLLMEQKEIPDGFIERDLRNTQYISKKAREILLEVCRNVVPVTGSVTNKLREDWQLINVLQELNWDKYDKLGLTKYEKSKDGKDIPKIIDWTKRNDHRHHAMDALAIAFTTRNHIQYLNNLNTIVSIKDYSELPHEKSDLYGIREKVIEVYEDKKGNTKKRFKSPIPIKEFRKEAKKHLENTLISFKAKNKVVTRNKNKTKKKGGYNEKIELTPRGQLHKETIYGKSKLLLEKPTKLNKKFTIEKANLIAIESVKKCVLDYMRVYENNSEKAFDTKRLKKKPILFKGESLTEVFCFEEIYTIRKEISPDLKIDKVLDLKVKEILKARLSEFGGNAKKAFVNLEDNPIWLNKKADIQIKRVTITGVSNAEALHYKKNHLGKEILDNKGEKIPVDYVSTGNNHHVAIYKDETGKLQEKVVSFYEAVIAVNNGMHIIDKSFNKHLGWEFIFTMKQNEMFVFLNEKTGFDPNNIDLLDEDNYAKISENLFRVQKTGTKDYTFRHHLETTIDSKLKDITYLRVGLNGINGAVKIRINHLGKIVHVGEY